MSEERSKVEELMEFLQVRGMSIGGMTLGPDATTEVVAEQMLNSLKELEQRALDGTLEEVELRDE